MKKIFSAIVSGITALFLTQCRGYYHGMGGPYHMMDNYYYGGGFMIILWILVLALIGAVAYMLIRKKGILQNEAPLDVLKRRYAKGEITKEQFEEMKRDIQE
jgi:putative membrane protein